jgi:hypothetical protein
MSGVRGCRRRTCLRSVTLDNMTYRSPGQKALLTSMTVVPVVAGEHGRVGIEAARVLLWLWIAHMEVLVVCTGCGSDCGSQAKGPVVGRVTTPW